MRLHKHTLQMVKAWELSYTHTQEMVKAGNEATHTYTLEMVKGWE